MAISNPDNIKKVQDSKAFLALLKQAVQGDDLKKVVTLLQQIKNPTNIQTWCMELQQVFFTDSANKAVKLECLRQLI
jgi:hypothetical protein